MRLARLTFLPKPHLPDTRGFWWHLGGYGHGQEAAFG